MTGLFNPVDNYETTKARVGYINRLEATPQTYSQLGFKCGLEIHQQLDTKKKLFCRCPVGVYQEPDDFDAVVVRHMRPTLSEMGEYDGTALMERKTRKQIVYRLKEATACTYEIDDTPPFPLNRDALAISIEIALMLKCNVVGELHITRKQYLDGSIPTGFQRTAIVGIEGKIPLRHKKVRIIQLSLEEDSCREVSDIGHQRIYRTDRLGTPLIEMVTYPDMLTPDEAAEAGNYLRYLTRSSAKVRTGIGAARQDVNVSITGGTRVEIKGVAHVKRIPSLTHNEAFRQKALLYIKDRLCSGTPDPAIWRVSSKTMSLSDIHELPNEVLEKTNQEDQVALVCLPGFHSLLSHFTQPGKCFADEISDRLKVIACLEKPNMIHTELSDSTITPDDLRRLINAGENDAVIMIWGDPLDIRQGIETIEERCLMAFQGVPNETRKSFPNGTTIFERVLPGPDRMYPDTDSAPIKIEQDLIDSIQSCLAPEVITYREQLDLWQVSLDAQDYLLSSNLMPLVGRIVDDCHVSDPWVCYLLAHRIKHLIGKHKTNQFDFDRVYQLVKYLSDNILEPELTKRLLPLMFVYPDQSFDHLLARLEYEKVPPDQLKALSVEAHDGFTQFKRSDPVQARFHWIMGRLSRKAIGNVRMSELRHLIEEGVTYG